MKRIRVSSSILVAVGYDPINKILEIEFADGRIRQYLNVLDITHERLMKSKQKGGFFKTYINNRFATREINAKKI